MGDLDPRPAVRALVERDGRYLLARLEFSDRRWWVLPGGGVESGEAPRATLRREVEEEVGLAVDVGDPVGCFAFENDYMGWYVVNTVFAASVAGGTVTVADNPDDEPLAGAEWFVPAAVADLPLAPGERRFFDRRG